MLASVQADDHSLTFFHGLSFRTAELQGGKSLGIIFLAVHKLPSKIGEELRRK